MISTFDLLLLQGQRHDITQAPELVESLNFEFIIADRAYGAQEFRDLLARRGIEPVIPSRQNAKHPRDYHQWQYHEPHLVECFINKIKHYRRIFSRFDKLASRYL